MFKILRILILILFLFSVWGTYLTQRSLSQEWASGDWSSGITIKIIPIIADSRASTRTFVKSLKPKDFNEISQYLYQSAKRFNFSLQPAPLLELEAPIDSLPPEIPESNTGLLKRLLWSVKLRWWAWRNQLPDHQDRHIRLFILYQSPDQGVSLPHSTGLRKGLIGLINARAFQQNKRFHNVVITHELLHIFGAKDKYDITTGIPIYPQGYVAANADPLWPQPYTEIMGRARPLSQTDFEVAERLRDTRISRLTAREIGWLE